MRVSSEISLLHCLINLLPLQREDANARFYGHPVTVPDILAGKYKAPSAAMPLLQTLYAAEGRPEVLGTDRIPEGLAPGDTELTEEEKKELEANGHGHEEHHASAIPQSSSSKSIGHRVPPPPPARHPPPSLEPDHSSDPPSYDTAFAAPAPAEKNPFDD